MLSIKNKNNKTLSILSHIIFNKKSILPLFYQIKQMNMLNITEVYNKQIYFNFIKQYFTLTLNDTQILNISPLTDDLMHMTINDLQKTLEKQVEIKIKKLLENKLKGVEDQYPAYQMHINDLINHFNVSTDNNQSFSNEYVMKRFNYYISQSQNKQQAKNEVLEYFKSISSSNFKFYVDSNLGLSEDVLRIQSEDFGYKPFNYTLVSTIKNYKFGTKKVYYSNYYYFSELEDLSFDQLELDKFNQLYSGLKKNKLLITSTINKNKHAIINYMYKQIVIKKMNNNNVHSKLTNNINLLKLLINLLEQNKYDIIEDDIEIFDHCFVKNSLVKNIN